MLQDTLKAIPGFTPKEKKSKSKKEKTSAVPNIVLNFVDKGGGEGKSCYDKCLSNEVSAGSDYDNRI